MTTAQEIKLGIQELQASIAALLEVLAKVREEGRALAERTHAPINWQWVERALGNVGAYQKQLSKAVADRDPANISYAAEQLVSTRKYFEDVALDWSELEKELRQCASTAAEKAGKVAYGIDPFDSASLAEIKRAL